MANEQAKPRSRWSVRLARIAGIDIRAHATLLILLAWIALDPLIGGRGVRAAVASLLLIVCVFAIIVVHELAHALVARRFGVPTRDITLLPIGGVSSLERIPERPRQELAIALAGPAVNVALAALLAGGLALAHASFAPGDEHALGVSFVAELLWINIGLAVFNLLPAFPMDGGRVLRAIVWGSTHDMQSSTRLVSGVGQAIGWGFIGLGIAMAFGLHVPFFGTGFIGGLWLAFIGWFLQSAAAQARTRVALDEILVGHTVEELMRRQGTVVSPDITIDTLVHDYFVPSEERAFPVMRDGRLLGLISISDVRGVVRDDWASTPVRAAMRGIESLITT
ncbi:MAG TPA: site-2 protease family protein, partial [Polyangia bacterium]